MLLQFTVSNFLSFDGETTFSMLADGGDGQHPNHLLRDDSEKDGVTLRAAAIYGANAAGKSNLIKAIQFARRLVVKGSNGDQSLGVIPFRLKKDSASQPSSFEFVFKHREVTYSYGFRATARQVTEEWLFATPHSPRAREMRLFERTTNSEGQTTVGFGSNLHSGDKQKQFLEFVAQGTRRNQLFLTEAFERNVEAVRPVIEWFDEVLTIIPAESKHEQLEVFVQSSINATRFIGEFLREAGTGIEEIRAKEYAINVDEVIAQVRDEKQSELQQVLSDLQDDEVLEVALPNNIRLMVVRNDKGELVQLQLRTIHRTQDGQEVEFPLEAESDGTQRLTHLIPALFAMNDKSKVIIVDELDRRLHPLLCRRFLEAGLQCGGAKGRSQLVFTTHDTNLLDLELLRRDEIWFVEKDANGSSRIYSLAEFNIRPDLKVAKGYLNGRFGAIPFFGDICRLGWTENATEVQEAHETAGVA